MSERLNSPLFIDSILPLLTVGGKGAQGAFLTTKLYFVRSGISYLLERYTYCTSPDSRTHRANKHRHANRQTFTESQSSSPWSHTKSDTLDSWVWLKSRLLSIVCISLSENLKLHFDVPNHLFLGAILLYLPFQYFICVLQCIFSQHWKYCIVLKEQRYAGQCAPNREQCFQYIELDNSWVCEP